MEDADREKIRNEMRKRGRNENPDLRIWEWNILRILLREVEGLLGREVVGKGTMGCLLIFNSCK